MANSISNSYSASVGNAGIGSATTNRAGGQAQAVPQALPPAPRADVNYIPADETIRTLTANAVQAQKRGVHWDRGSILNLLL